MQMRSSKKDQGEDVNLMAARIIREMEKEHDFGGKNLAAMALGRLGGLKGGKARAAKLTQKQRHEIAQKAAEARWKK